MKLAALIVVLSGALFGGGWLYGQATDFNGLISGDNWLILGPFANPFACDGIDDDLLGNHIAPANIACQFPQDGDEINYDPAQSVSTGYVGPAGPTGEPVWRPFDDGAPDSDLNLDGDVGGDLTDVMSWLVTYVQYTGASPTVVQFCVGSDDGVQVWLDNTLVHNHSSCRGRGLCDDLFGVLVKPGVHRIAMGIWERAGGWGGSLGLQLNGDPITDDPTLWPDWTFLGREGTVNIPNCTPPQAPFPEGVGSLNCAARGDGGIDLTWTNPPTANTAVAIAIYIDGVQKTTVPGTATSFTVTPANLPSPGSTVCVVNSSGLGACCSGQVTDAGGLIKSSHWLVLGPFAEPFGCNNNNNSILGNHIAPSCIQGQYPEAGDEIDYDPDPAVTTAYVGPTGPGGGPVWRAFDDGSDNGDNDLDADVNGDQSTVMSWLATYVEYKGAAPIDIQLCVGSDDGVQVWFNNILVHNNNACRGRGVCQDIVPVNGLAKGIYCIKIGTWENGGGWGSSLGLQLQADGSPITDGDPDWTFWGRTKPAGAPNIPCPACLSPVTNLTCAFTQIVGGQGVTLSWTNPSGCDLPGLADTRIQVNGVDKRSVSSTATTGILPPATLPAGGGVFTITVINSSGLPTECCLQRTDDQGLIRSNNWLVLGPFSEPFGCNGDNNSILDNHIAPSHICEQYPAAGDEIDYDPAQSVTTAYVGPAGPGGGPIWRQFDDGGPCDSDNNLDADVNGDQSTVMSWMATYIEYKGADPANIELCVGSDDGVQVWIDDQLAHNNNACRARGVCQDIVPFTLKPGMHCIKIGTWENGGGWGSSLGLHLDGNPVLDDGSNPDFVFHGTTRPVPVNQFPVCVPPCPAVTIQNCSFNAAHGIDLSWENPACDKPPATISILVNGVETGTVAGSATSFTVPPGGVPEGAVRVTVDNGAIRPASCGLLNGTELYINCGGLEFVDGQGRVWTEDSLTNPSAFLTGPNQFTADFLNPGNVDVASDPVVSAKQYPQEIFPVERWNDGPIEYTISGFPTGDYTVTLLFMEGCCSDGCEDIPDPALSAGGCRVFDILINDQIVDDQFSQNVIASQEAGVAPGVTANYVAVARVYQVTGVGSIKVHIEDLGAGNPPENASIKGIAINRAGGLGGFHRGDSDNNGQLQLTDAVRILGFLFLGGIPPTCKDAADSDGNNSLQLTDAVRILGYLFLGGIPPVSPGPPPQPCGPDNDATHLGCDLYDKC
jgi:hypothetical protein